MTMVSAPPSRQRRYNNASAGQAMVFPSGSMYVNASHTGTGASWSTGTGTVTVGQAWDFTHTNWWYTIDGTHWNSASSGTNSPITNVGGLSFSAVNTAALFLIAGVEAGFSPSPTWTLNAGASAFTFSTAAAALFTAGYTGWTG